MENEYRLFLALDISVYIGITKYFWRVCKISSIDFLPARRYASAGYRDRNVSVRLSVCPSRAGIVSKPRKRHDFYTIW